MAKQRTPREGAFMGMAIVNCTFPDGTWVEGEEFAYPDGGYTRMAYADCSDGVRRIVRCSIADTFFTIPARYTVAGKRVRGFLTCDESGVKFNEYKPKEEPVAKKKKADGDERRSLSLNRRQVLVVSALLEAADKDLWSINDMLRPHAGVSTIPDQIVAGGAVTDAVTPDEVQELIAAIERMQEG